MNEIMKYKQRETLKENYFFNLLELQTSHSSYTDRETILKIRKCCEYFCKRTGCYGYSVYIAGRTNGWFCGLKNRFIKKEEGNNER